jgi:hypothetical protein
VLSGINWSTFQRCLLLPWSEWRVTLKCQSVSTRLHSTISQNTVIFMLKKSYCLQGCSTVLSFTAFLFVALCCLVETDQHFRHAYCLRYQGDKLLKCQSASTRLHSTRSQNIVIFTLRKSNFMKIFFLWSTQIYYNDNSEYNITVSLFLRLDVTYLSLISASVL